MAHLPHLSDDELQGLAELRTATDPHLAACAECGEVVEAYRTLGRELAALPPPSVPAGFSAAVVARLDRRPATAWLWGLALASGLASLALMAVGGAAPLWGFLRQDAASAGALARVALDLAPLGRGLPQLVLVGLLSAATLLFLVPLWRLSAHPRREVA